MPPESREKSNTPVQLHPGFDWLVISGVFVSLSCVLWLPFGLHRTAILDEWLFYGDLTQRVSPLMSEELMALAGTPNRWLGAIPYWTGYLLTPGSFVGLNVVHMAITVAKGLAFFGVLRRCGVGTDISFGASLLFMVYPADSWSFNPLIVGYDLTILAFLCAVHCLLRYWETPRAGWLLLMSGCLLISLNSEVSYVLAFAVPVLLLLKRGQHSWGRLIRVSALWYATPAVLGSWTLWLYFTGRLGYVSGMLAVGEDPNDWFHYLSRAFYNCYAVGWVNAFRVFFTQTERTFMMLSVTAAVAAGMAAFCLSRYSTSAPQQGSASIRQCMNLIEIGCVIFVLGFAVFLASSSLRPTTDRVFLFAGAGAALSIAALMHLCARILPWRNVLFAILLALFVAPAVATALTRSRAIQALSFEEQEFLSGVIEKVPAVSGKALLMLWEDGNHAPLQDRGFYLRYTSHRLNSAIQYLYSNPDLRTTLYRPEAQPWGALGEQCRPGSEGLVLSSRLPLSSHPVTFPYERVILLRLRQNGVWELTEKLPVPDEFAKAASAYRPAALFNPEGRPPHRALTALARWPFRPLPLAGVVPQRSVRLDFAASSELSVLRAPPDPSPPRIFADHILGRGWSASTSGFATMTGPSATLDIAVGRNRAYTITFRVVPLDSQALDGDITLEVNGRQLPLELRIAPKGSRTYRASISADVMALNAENTRFTFSKRNKEGGMSMESDPNFRFAWLEVKPSST